MAFLLPTVLPPPPEQRGVGLGKSAAQFPIPSLKLERAEQSSLATFSPSRDCLNNFVSPNMNLRWEEAIDATWESWRKTKTVDIWSKKSGVETHNRPSKTPRRSWGKTLWEIKTFKGRSVYGGLKIGTQFQERLMLRKRPEKTLNFLLKLRKCLAN